MNTQVSDTIRRCIQKFPDWVDNEINNNIKNLWEATQWINAVILTRLTHKTAIQLQLVAERAVPVPVLAQGGQSGNFWIHPRNLPEMWTFISRYRFNSSHKINAYRFLIITIEEAQLQYFCIPLDSSQKFSVTPPKPTVSEAHIWGCIQKFPDWPPGARTANGTALCQ
jgi:hypothetical protein